MYYQRCIADEGKKLIGGVNEALMALQKLGGQTVDREGFGRNIAFGI